MKNYQTKPLTKLSLGAACLGALTAQTAFAKVTDHKVGRPEAGPVHQHFTVIVDDQGYHPATVKVKAGAQVRLKFVSRGDSCSNGVRIPSLHKSINLQQGQSAEIRFTPKKGQTINFACQMGMYTGKIVAK